jgi:hypothetical protein
MKVTGAILQRYYNLPKTKVVGRVGQASRLPWRNQASQARRLRYTGRMPSYASWIQVTLNRVVAIYTQNRIWSGLQADQETQEELMKARRWIKIPISFAIIYSFSVTSVVNPSRIWQNK